MEIVKFKPSSEFREISEKVFEEQKQIILEKLPFAEVHHVAGTSIPDLVTKGDLDLNVRVIKEKFSDSVEKLKQIYEINQLENWTPSYASFKDDKNLEIELGVQVTIIGSSGDHFLKHKEILLSNPKLVDELNKLKLKFEGRPMDEYRKEKDIFFKKLE